MSCVLPRYHQPGIISRGTTMIPTISTHGFLQGFGTTEVWPHRHEPDQAPRPSPNPSPDPVPEPDPEADPDRLPLHDPEPEAEPMSLRYGAG
ncbi:hypothetical protein AZKH_2655 [Azoarcus sp. KH32C]|nr:hypothetical protein AZKH_2655 [Azoarcus sp. KH32C]